MEITNQAEYGEAISRANQLRNAGQTATSSLELAALDAAIQAYGQKMDRPETRPGRPSPYPYRADD